MKRVAGWMIAPCALLFVVAAAAETQAPRVDPDGTIHGDLGPLPVSSFLSEPAKAELVKQFEDANAMPTDGGIDEIREASDARAKKHLEGWRETADVDISDTEMGGVHVHVVTPADGVAPENKQRVLINAHGGGFFLGAAYGGQLEAVPMAHVGKVKVIAVDYRMAPEHIYPAASEDMEAVYRAVLETTEAENVGFYGCSAGGTLVGQMIPWLREKNLPLPGAIGVFCAGLMETFWFLGDAGVFAGLANARPRSDSLPTPRWRPYFDGIDRNQPMITPGAFPETLVGYPPTLIVTGTRDIAMSNAIVTHTRMLTAGVEAELFIQEGLGHGHFAYIPGIPESITAHEIIWAFFDRRLGP